MYDPSQVYHLMLRSDPKPDRSNRIYVREKHGAPAFLGFSRGNSKKVGVSVERLRACLGCVSLGCGVVLC